MALALVPRLPARCAALVTIAALLGCGPSSPAATSPSPTAEASQPAPSAASATTAPSTASAAPSAEPATAQPAKPGAPADASPPAGVSPLTEPEQKELASKCKKLSEAIAAVARKDGGKKRPVDYITAVLAAPPKLPGTDIPRCSELLTRDTVAYMARTREGEAKVNLKRIVVGLMSAIERDPPVFCASAPPVPAALEAVKDTPYSSVNADWSGAGWKCARFELIGGPQVFQYELRTDAKARTFEVIARGYPVQGGPATELYVAGKVESGVIDPSMPVMRR